MKSRPHIVAAALALALALSACGTVRDLVGQSAVNDCVKTTCNDREAQAYQACEAACLSRYR
jgi:stage V sporulation protein SpoVS